MRAEDKKPDPLTTRLREQLLLSQARIMELEDARDVLAQHLADERGLVSAAQSLADGALDKFTHLEKVHSVLEEEFRHMRHMQHVTNEALEDTRSRFKDANEQVASMTTRIDALVAMQDLQKAELTDERAKVSRLDTELAAAQRSLHLAEIRVAELDAQISELSKAANERESRISDLAAERRAMIDSRSWRWSAPVRAIERWLRR